MYDLSAYLPVKRKVTASGWISFNSVCCQHNGHKPDRRGRGGIKFEDDGWVYHCFNCGYSTSFVLGKPLGFRSRMLLTWFGVGHEDIERINLESLKYKNIFGLISDNKPKNVEVHFETDIELPAGAVLVQPHHQLQWQYLRSRSVPIDVPILSVIDEKRYQWRPNVIVPFTWNNRIVGYTARMLDNRKPKYISHSQMGYVFGCDLLNTSAHYVLVMEGIFDALSVGGIAVMHNDINDKQAQYIRSLGKSVIYVPDQDQAGLTTTDRALELGWAVSIPNWPSDIKDVNDAVVKYSRLGALSQIVRSRETSRIKIELAKKQLTKRLKGSSNKPC